MGRSSARWLAGEWSEQETKTQCARCNTENPEEASFCLTCGANLTLICSECGTELPPHARFCFACGTQVIVSDPAAERGSAALSKALQRLVPREFAERLLATRSQVTSERRILTMLFSDVKGSTSMAEKLDPEEVLGLMDGAFDVLIEPIMRYEGTLARLGGDGILAFFGAPIAHENDAERACRAALDIIAGAQEYAARLEEERGIAGFSVRVGIHTGLVVGILQWLGLRRHIACAGWWVLASPVGWAVGSSAARAVDRAVVVPIPWTVGLPLLLGVFGAMHGAMTGSVVGPCRQYR